MFTALKTALRPTFSNIVTGAQYAIGAGIGYGLIKGAGNMLTKGAESISRKVEEKKFERQMKREAAAVEASAA